MANQPSARPWFRLPRQPPPPAAPAPAVQAQPQPAAPQQPRLPIVRPTFRPAFTQSQPAPAPPQPPTAAPSPPPPPRPAPSPMASPSPPPSHPATGPYRSPAITSPSPPHLSPSPAPTMTSPRASPRLSTQAFQSATKATRSPSPISLPPSQVKSSKGELEPRAESEDEQKKVLLQETFNKQVVFPAPKANSGEGFGNAYNNSSKYGRFKEADGRKSSSDSEDGSVRIISMVNDNKGAVMELGFSSSINKGGKHGHGSGRIVGNDSGVSNDKIQDHKGITTSSNLPMNVYVNSNVQGINSSILYNCSFTHHDPGVHLSLSRKPIYGNGKGNDYGIGPGDNAN